MTTTTQFQLGSISTGTLLTKDLLPAFIKTLAGFVPDHDLVHVAWEDTEDNIEDLLEDLDQALQLICPPFVFFGTYHDGADFGFWPDHDALQEAMQTHQRECKGYACIGGGHPTIWLDEHQCYLAHTYHGDVTVMDLDRNVLWTTA